jgi:hypothetical protein
MQKNEVSTDQAGKISVLMGALNFLLAPIYWANSKVGLAASISLTGAAIYGLHEVGKEERAGENAVHNVSKFFSPLTGAPSSDMKNALQNIAKGGEVIFDKFAPD